MPSRWDESEITSDVRALADGVLDAAFAVHRALGPGYLESIYRRSLAYELRTRGHDAKEEVWLPVRYRDLVFHRSHRADMIVDDRLLVEVKAVEQLHQVHGAQLMSYLKASGLQAGLLLNFQVKWFRNGYDRFVHPERLAPRFRGFAEPSQPR